jgi:hypothetical protein
MRDCPLRQRLVEAFPAQSGILGDPRHAAGAGYVPDCRDDKIGIADIKDLFQIKSNVLLRVWPLCPPDDFPLF